MTFDRNRLARGLAVALVSFFLVAGAAFAAGGILTPLSAPTGPSIEATGTPEPSETPDATDDQGDDQGQDEATETPEPSETPEATETPEPSETPDATDDQDDDQDEATETPEPSETPDATDDSGSGDSGSESHDGGSDD